MRKKLLLLINGNQTLMDLTRKILERECYSVRCATGLAGAREYLVDLTPDGIILEYELPDGKGLDYCRELRRKSAVPIMFLSNNKEDELLALQAGANDFLKKPYDHDIMIARIGTMLNTCARAVQTMDSKEYTEDSTDIFRKTIPAAQSLNLVRQSCETKHVKKKKLKLRNYCVTAAACIVLVLIGAGVINVLNNRAQNIVVPDKQVPLAGSPFTIDKNSKPFTEKEQGVKFFYTKDLCIPADITSINFLLLNPNGNPSYFMYEIVLTDTGELLYQSDLVPPGMCLETITISRGLAEGEYGAEMNIHAYSLDDFASMGIASLKLHITAE